MSADAAATPQFELAARRLLQRLDHLAHDREQLELAVARLSNMVATQRQWQRRAALRGRGEAAADFLESLEAGLARARALLAAAGAGVQGG